MSGEEPNHTEELFKTTANPDYAYFPYRMVPQMVNDLLTGEIYMMVDAHTYWVRMSSEEFLKESQTR